MAFMLITIIILGTGEKISEEHPGSLLGTVAGYIFGRMGNERDENNSRSHELQTSERKTRPPTQQKVDKT